jgi:hypothetical protein
MQADDNDIQFERTLTAALYRAAELDYEPIGTGDHIAPARRPSLRFRRRMRALLRNPRGYVRNLRRGARARALRAAAAALVALVVFLGAAVAVSPAVRATVVGFVASWLSDRTEYFIPEAGEIGGWSFGYIPKGFELIDAPALDGQYLYIYENADSVPLSILITAGRVIVDNEHSDHYRTTIKGNAADVYVSNTHLYPSQIVMYIEPERVFVCISSEIAIDELIKVAENVRKK